MTVSILLVAILPALLVAAAIFDLASFTIPNMLPAAMFALFAAFLLATMLNGHGLSWSETWPHLLAGGVALVASVALFAAGWVAAETQSFSRWRVCGRLGRDVVHAGRIASRRNVVGRASGAAEVSFAAGVGRATVAGSPRGRQFGRPLRGRARDGGARRSSGYGAISHRCNKLIARRENTRQKQSFFLISLIEF
jgi:hypothetical protein